MDGSGLEAALEKNNKVEMLNIVQVESGQAVEINPDRDKQSRNRNHEYDVLGVFSIKKRFL